MLLQESYRTNLTWRKVGQHNMEGKTPEAEEGNGHFARVDQEVLLKGLARGDEEMLYCPRIG